MRISGQFITLITLLVFTLCIESRSVYTAEKPRVLVLTDMGNEPDDSMSMIRFLIYSNEFDVEGLVATTSASLTSKVNPHLITERIQAFAKVRNNLLLHTSGYPEVDYLLKITKAGVPKFGMKGVGEGNDSGGSQIIIDAADKPDPRPLWITVWGGPNTLAQALWKVKNTRTPAQVDAFVSKLRVYDIKGQDDSGPWIRKTFPNLFYMVGVQWRGISVGGDQSLANDAWIDKHVKGHGPMGDLYPHIADKLEGDSPSFLYLIPTGLGDPEHPEYGSWGGRYVLKGGYYQDTNDVWNGEAHYMNAVRRWRRDFQNDFQARMDWNIMPFDKANHPPVAVFQGPLRQNVAPGRTITLSAAGSSDPDRNNLSYKWFFYDEPSTYDGSLTINNANSQQASFTVPNAQTGRNIHIILTVTDDGNPALTRYQRVIFTVDPNNTSPQEQKASINLAPGWNLISLPVEPSNSNIQSVLSGIKYAALYAFDGTRYQTYIPGESGNDLQRLEAGRGYWLYTEEAGTLNIQGQAASKAISLKSGWNLVGVNSMNALQVSTAAQSLAGKLEAIYGFDTGTNSYKGYVPSMVSDLTTLRPGEGYWVYVSENVSWNQKSSS
jgi:hypothetical protein